jgi:glyoxylase-like metal-dependent hydrolase (beta-lactamase superfamily II)
MANVTDMPSRRRFIKSAFGTAAALMLADATADAAAQEADLTTAQMRLGGKTAKLSIQSLRDNVSLISGSGGNVLLLAGADGKLVVDSGLATSRPQMSTALKSISTKPLRFLINTHWHFDHTDGNEWMHATGAKIFAHEKTLARMQHKQVIPEFEGVFPPSPTGALPTVTFERTQNLEAYGQKINLVRYTPAHTDTDISVFLAEADVLHTGDSFFNGIYPFIDYSSGGSIDGMIAACRESLALAGPSTIVVCGHGPAGSRGDILAFEEMLVDVRNSVATSKKAGISLQEAIARKPTASYDKKWGGGFISPDLFTSLVYRGV